VNLLLLGPPGAGKGTQAKRVANEYGIAHLSTGEMFRAAIEAGTDIGRQVEPILARGELVPDELTVGLIRERLTSNATNGFVLDGFPRNQAQSDALDDLLGDLDRELDAVLFFNLSDEVATDRVLGRAGEEQRTDDTPETIAHRLSIYHSTTEPVVEHYRVTGKLVPLHADRAADQVWVEIQQALEQVNGRVPK